MIKSTSLGTMFTIFALVWFVIPHKDTKTTPHESEIKSLAFSYGVYHKSICPNQKMLKQIKYEYSRHIPITNVTDRAWIDENFERVFSEECFDHETRRAGE